MKLGTLFVVLMALVALAAAPASAAVKINKKAVSLKTKAYEIDVQYPVTGVKAVDDVVGQFARARLAEYKDDAGDHDKDEMAYSFDLGYTIERNDNQVLAILFTELSYTGGAHPNSTMYSFNFLMPDGAQVFLPEILDGKRGIDRISAYAVKDLNKQLAGPDGGSDTDWIGRGAGPLASNFSVFILQPKLIDLQFTSYQVASYAAGPQEVKVPLSYLNGYIRKDWRAPQASFDCSKARSAIEHAICGDAMLARMDRQAAEQYAENLANSYEASEGDKWRTTQRAWLANRDKTCNGPVPAACLRKSYAARMAELLKPVQ